MTESAKKYDLLIKNVRVVRPRKTGIEKMDIAVQGGKVKKVAKGIAADSAREIVDGKNKLAFPGLVDPHMHCGIYGPLDEDARSESLAAAQGGVTSSLNYMRTGGYYMERGGPYAEVYPEVLAASKDNFWVDYAYHLAPLDRTHIGEIDMLMDDTEVHMKAGDVLVQQGTNHAWVNNGTKPCRIAFILIDAKEPPAWKQGWTK